MSSQMQLLSMKVNAKSFKAKNYIVSSFDRIEDSLSSLFIHLLSTLDFCLLISSSSLLTSLSRNRKKDEANRFPDRFDIQEEDGMNK